jgi:HSP20 family protein
MTTKTQTLWQPFQDLGEDDPRSAQDATDLVRGMLAQMLGRDGSRPTLATGASPAWAPTLDVSERSDAYLVAVELPGVQPDDLEVAFEDGLLTVQGERHFAHDSSEQRLHRVERRYGAFRRSVTLPNHVVADAIEATTTDGVLQIVVPKAEDTKPRRIKVLSPGPVTAPSTVATSSDG